MKQNQSARALLRAAATYMESNREARAIIRELCAALEALQKGHTHAREVRARNALDRARRYLEEPLPPAKPRAMAELAASMNRAARKTLVRDLRP